MLEPSKKLLISFDFQDGLGVYHVLDVLNYHNLVNI
jgi:hypothetical protein